MRKGEKTPKAGHGDHFVEAIAQRVADILRPLLEARQTVARLLSVEAAAVLLGRTDWAVRALINAGTLRPVRIDSRVMLDVQDLEQLIKSSKT